MDASGARGTLYVVATPIGNMEDMTARAKSALGAARWIAAEDTRRTARLLAHFGIGGQLVSYHDHSDAKTRTTLLESLIGGDAVALVSDAGTPLVADPGYRLVRAAQDAGVAVAPVPGACALAAAISVAGQPCERFAFEGFLPARAPARRRRLAELALAEHTTAFFEAPHRLAACLDDMREAFGERREATLARELTKRFETVRRDSLGALAAWVGADPARRRGEVAVLVSGCDAAERRRREGERVLAALAEELPPRQAAALAARISGCGRSALYRRALRIAAGEPAR